MTVEIRKQLEQLRKRVLKLRGCVRTFEEEVLVNNIKYAIEQAERVFKNHPKRGQKL